MNKKEMGGVVEDPIELFSQYVKVAGIGRLEEDEGGNPALQGKEARPDQRRDLDFVVVQLLWQALSAGGEIGQCR